MVDENSGAGEAVSAVRLKAELLARGVKPTPLFLSVFGPPYLAKRRAYGNPDDVSYLGRSLPQEMYILPERLICAANVRADSCWELDWSQELGFFVRCGDLRTPVSFPRTPSFYERKLPDGRPARDVITLYGGGSFGVFVHGNCSLVDMGKACQYCSIAPNRSRQTDFPQVVSEDMLRAGLRLALKDEECPVSQIMINGGNFRDPDRSFLYYARLCAAAREVIDESRREVELHLIVYPPADLELLRELAGLNLSVAMNMEVFDPLLFQEFCPGKDAVLGQAHTLSALSRAAILLGSGHVFSILVGGLEEQRSLAAGMKLLVEMGTIPVINVFHPDPETPLQNRSAPSADQILEMGACLQEVYQSASFARPFYSGCGRNSLDTEAHLKMFQGGMA